MSIIEEHKKLEKEIMDEFHKTLYPIDRETWFDKLDNFNNFLQQDNIKPKVKRLKVLKKLYEIEQETKND